MNLLTIDEISKLPKQPIDRTDSTGHVYFLFSMDELVYVGQSIRLSGRIRDHLKSSKKFDSFAFVEVPVNLLDSVEYHYIVALKPKLNRQACRTKPPVHNSSGNQQLCLHQECVSMRQLKSDIWQLYANPKLSRYTDNREAIETQLARLTPFMCNDCECNRHKPEDCWSYQLHWIQGGYSPDLMSDEKTST